MQGARGGGGLAAEAPPALLRSKLFWVGILYFSEGFPLGVYYEMLPVWFRQQNVDLRSIGAISLLGLAWTLKFLWAPAVDHYRHHRAWMATADVAMGIIMLVFAFGAGLGPWVWGAIALFTLASATNDVAIDGYTIELLDKRELGLANGVRIGLYRVGMLASGLLLIVAHRLGWAAAFMCGAAVLVAAATAVSRAPRETFRSRVATPIRETLRQIGTERFLGAGLACFGLFVVGLVALEFLSRYARPGLFRTVMALEVGLLCLTAALLRAAAVRRAALVATPNPALGSLMELFARPGVIPVLLFVLIFKLGDASMGFMVKPFWVDAGFTAEEIGLVSVNVGLLLSIAGGVIGGWYTDRAGIFKGLWVLGLLQALSNLGYALAATIVPHGGGTRPDLLHHGIIYAASAAESFTGGLGTAAFLAFLMAIVDKRHAAAEFALLSSVFALSRSIAGWGSGYGAETLGYAPYFLLTFFLSFPAYLLLPWARRMLAWRDARDADAVSAAPRSVA